MTPLFLVYESGLRGTSPSLVYERPGSSQETKSRARRTLSVREITESDLQKIDTSTQGGTLLDALVRMFPYEGEGG